MRDGNEWRLVEDVAESEVVPLNEDTKCVGGVVKADPQSPCKVVIYNSVSHRGIIL